MHDYNVDFALIHRWPMLDSTQVHDQQGATRVLGLVSNFLLFLKLLQPFFSDKMPTERRYRVY